jgi:hypothetical protein
MKRVWGHVLGAISLLGCGGIVFFSCVHNDSTIFIQDVIAPQEVANNQPCVFTASTTQTFLSSGVLDLDFRASYEAEFLVGNQMVAEANSPQLVTETSTVTLQGAVIRITDASGKNQLATFTRLTSGTIYPASGNVPGYAAIGTTIVDSNTVLNNPDIRDKVLRAPARAASVRLVTYLRFFGNTLGGRYVESDEFEFPVDVCKGCLITFSPQDINPNADVPNCIGPCSANGAASTQAPIPCVVGQDLPIDCVQCQGVPDCMPNANTLRTTDGGCTK